MASQPLQQLYEKQLRTGALLGASKPRTLLPLRLSLTSGGSGWVLRPSRSKTLTFRWLLSSDCPRSLDPTSTLRLLLSELISGGATQTPDELR